MFLQIHEPGQSPLPHAERAEIAVGIDLGTTNSLVALSESEKPEVILNKNGNYLTPSVIAVDETGKIEVGNISAKQNAIRSVKRLMGLGLKDIADVSELGFEIDAANSDKIIRIKSGNKTITPVEVSAEILRSLKESAETALGHKVTKAVITVPAYFDDAARLATKDAAAIAGLEVLRLINEPTAAALAYGLDKGSEGTFAIYDLGGGTFDITILKMQKGVFQVIATGGDARLGGDDFDNLIFKKIIKDLGLQNLSHDEVNYLNLAARKLKEQLTDNNSAKSELNISGKTFNVEISKAEFESLASSLVEKTISIFESTIEDAEIEVEQIKGVVLVGGSTRVPLVQKKLEEFVGKKPLSDVDPDKVVALGAAIQAESLTYGSENLLIDVNPLSLGLETYGGLMEVLISRNTPIPTKAEQKFTTYEDGQTAMSIHILQGEREMVEHCRSLAKFDLRGIPAMPAGTAIIVVKFSLDADGILTVSAMEETTGKEQKIEVKPSYGLEASEIEKMLYSSIENAQSDIKLKMLVQSRNEAEIVVKTLESALSKDEALISADYKKSLENKISELKTAIVGTDRELIDFEVLELDKLATDFADARVSSALKNFMAGQSVDEVNNKLK